MTVDKDLEDPAPRKYRSEEELREHYWKLMCTLFFVAAAYSSIHKLFIPLFLAQTKVLDQRYTLIDFWILPVWILALLLYKEGHLKLKGSFFAGLVVAYAAWDLRNILTGVHPGWLAWSHALSSLPVGLAALFLLTRSERQRSLMSAWTGAGVSALILLVLSFAGEPTGASKVASALLDDDENVLALEEGSCGKNEFRVVLDEVQALQKNVLVRECGFYPQSLLVRRDHSLEVRSELDGTLNVHVIFIDTEGRRRRHRNRILKASESFRWNEFKFQENEIAALVFSDSRRDLGIVLASNPAFLGQGWELVLRADRSVKVVSKEGDLR